MMTLLLMCTSLWVSGQSFAPISDRRAHKAEKGEDQRWCAADMAAAQPGQAGLATVSVARHAPNENPGLDLQDQKVGSRASRSPASDHLTSIVPLCNLGLVPVIRHTLLIGLVSRQGLHCTLPPASIAIYAFHCKHSLCLPELPARRGGCSPGSVAPGLLVPSLA